MAVEIVAVPGESQGLLEAAVALGNRYRRQLGLLTPPAYRKYAEDGGLLVAREDKEVVGYALFGLPKRDYHVRLAHLCVAREHRERGVARRLVQEIRERHPQRLGIKARCRRDYGLSDMWTSLGFVPRGEGLGRGHTRETLDTWWLDFGHQDLFADAQSDALLAVSVDHSVFAGLRGIGAERDVEEARALEAGWLVDLVELTYTPQLLHDVRDVAESSIRQHQRAGLAGLRSLSPNADAVATRHEELLTAVAGERARPASGCSTAQSPALRGRNLVRRAPSLGDP